jgi:hypothetical protein
LAGLSTFAGFAPLADFTTLAGFDDFSAFFSDLPALGLFTLALTSSFLAFAMMFSSYLLWA